MQDYPLVLLPKNTYKLKIEFQSENLETLYLVRRSLVKRDETETDLGSVRSHAFIEEGKEHLFYSLSCNLLGLFCKEHIVFILDKQGGRKVWSNKEVIPSIGDITFSVNEDTCPLYLKVAGIHEQPHHYTKRKPDGKPVDFTGQCKAVHKPLEANYWHFEINVLEEETKKTIGTSETDWKKEAARNFFESYLKRILTTKDVTANLPEDIYIE